MDGWRQAAARGAILGLAGGLAFLAVHALVVKPIWGAWWRAALYGPFAGALLALAHHRLRAREPWAASAWGAVGVGGLAGLALAPFALAGWIRSHGAPDPFWIAILAMLGLALHQLFSATQREPSGPRRLELLGLALAANALPAYFLVFAADFHDEVPDPFPIALGLAALYVAAGAALALWARRKGRIT